MAAVAPKIQFTNQLVGLYTKLREVERQIDQLTDIYFDLGFDGVGSDPIIDADLSADFNLTATQVASAITLLQQLTNFFGNAAVTQADYGATLSVMDLAR